MRHETLEIINYNYFVSVLEQREMKELDVKMKKKEWNRTKRKREFAHPQNEMKVMLKGTPSVKFLWIMLCGCRGTFLSLELSDA